MGFVVKHIKWIMLLSGVLTCTMVYAAIAPQAALRASFGETLEGPLADIVVRNWGALITLVGAMLIYGAFNPPNWKLALVVAGASKTVFIALVLAQRGRYFGQQVDIAIVIDLVTVVLFAVYLFGARHPRAESAG